MVSFPIRLKQSRKIRSMTQKQVAEGIQVPETQYQKYEHGKVKPSYDIIIKLCYHLNLSADYLLSLTDEPRPLE